MFAEIKVQELVPGQDLYVGGNFIGKVVSVKEFSLHKASSDEDDRRRPDWDDERYNRPLRRARKEAREAELAYKEKPQHVTVFYGKFPYRTRTFDYDTVVQTWQKQDAA